MIFDIITLFPEVFTPLQESILKRAQKAKLITINLNNLRNYTSDKHKTVDDSPYGGGYGMVLKSEPIFKAVESLKKKSPKALTILLCAQGKLLTQEKAYKLSRKKHLILICGHYEGVDERIREHLVDEEISIGDYVLTGGELPAMVLVDVVSRLIPGVIQAGSLEDESFNKGLLDYPQYTRPVEFKRHSVPEILLSGNHQLIEEWRKKQALKRTYFKRPDLIDKNMLTAKEKKWLEEIINLSE